MKEYRIVCDGIIEAEDHQTAAAEMAIYIQELGKHADDPLRPPPKSPIVGAGSARIEAIVR